MRRRAWPLGSVAGRSLRHQLQATATTTPTGAVVIAQTPNTAEYQRPALVAVEVEAAGILMYHNSASKDASALLFSARCPSTEYR
jgi:hypothetical protein